MSVDVKSILENVELPEGVEIETLAETLENGVNEQISEKYIDKEEHTRQVGAVTAKYKNASKKNTEQTDPEQNSNDKEETIDVEKVFEQKISAYEKQKQQEQTINEKLSGIKDEYKDYVKFKLERNEDFDISTLDDNMKIVEQPLTTKKNTNANISSNTDNVDLSDRQKAFLGKL